MRLFLLILWLLGFIISTIGIIYCVVKDNYLVQTKGELIMLIIMALIPGGNLVLSIMFVGEWAKRNLPWLINWLSSPIRRK